MVQFPTLFEFLVDTEGNGAREGRKEDILNMGSNGSTGVEVNRIELNERGCKEGFFGRNAARESIGNAGEFMVEYGLIPPSAGTRGRVCNFLLMCVHVRLTLLVVGRSKEFDKTAFVET